jgi:hypothetical protein
MRRVLDIDQIQSTGGRSLGSRTAIATRQQLGDPPYRFTPIPYRQQRAGDISHHVMQERVSLYFQYYQVTATPHVDKLNVPHRRPRLAGSGADGAKILFAQKRLRCQVHGRGIKGPAIPGQLPMHQRWANHGISNDIAIAARQR